MLYKKELTLLTIFRSTHWDSSGKSCSPRRIKKPHTEITKSNKCSKNILYLIHLVFIAAFFSTKEFPWFVNKILVELMEVIYQNICLQNWENIANRYKTGCHASINIAVPSWIKIFTPRRNNCIFIMNQNTSPLHQVFLPLIESSQRPPQKDWIFHITS